MENVAPPEEAPREEKLAYYQKELPGLLLECVREEQFAGLLPEFDALVVDEAQDHDTSFPETLDDDGPFTECGWWSIYLALLNEGGAAPMALFYDTAQRPPFRFEAVFDPRRVAAAMSQPAFARLPHALRYTQPVYDFLLTLKSPGTAALLDQLSEPDDLPEGPEVIQTRAAENSPEATLAVVNHIISTWVEEGYCQPDDILVLHARTNLPESVLGACKEIAGLPAIEYGQTPPAGQSAIRHLSINRAKGLDSLAVIMVGLRPFAELPHSDYQHTYFMGASRAKQLLAVVHR